ncbi:MAG TPA: hypothetical protein VIU64_06860, partial [Polyangia bacterium]
PEDLPAHLASRPTADQIARFARLTPEERFHWLVDLLALCYELATPEARASWHQQKTAQR